MLQNVIYAEFDTDRRRRATVEIGNTVGRPQRCSGTLSLPGRFNRNGSLDYFDGGETRAVAEFSDELVSVQPCRAARAHASAKFK